MEESIFSEPEVLGLLEQLVEIRMHAQLPDAPGEEERIAQMIERFDGDTTLPKYEIVEPASGKRLGAFFGADLTGNQFAAFLRKHLSPGKG